MATRAIKLSPDRFAPTTGFSGDSMPGVFRGINVKLRGLDSVPKVETYPGSKDIGENYTITSDTLAGTLTWTTTSKTITGSGTSFRSELRPGQLIFSADQPIVVNRVVSDTEFVAERLPTAAGTTKAAYFSKMLVEVDKMRAALRRGSVIIQERKSLMAVGDGRLFLNGTDTGFDITRRPTRIERAPGTGSSSGPAAYNSAVQYPIGFDSAPPVPTVDPVAGGYKKMQAGKYSYRFSYWNSTTDGHSNPSQAVKLNSGGTVEMELTAGQRPKFDLTNAINGMPANADGLVIWQNQSGGGVAGVNAAYFNNGPWFEARKIRTTVRDFNENNVDTALDAITVPDHGFNTGDSIFFSYSIDGVAAAYAEFFAIRVDDNTIAAASTALLAIAGTRVALVAPALGDYTVNSIDNNDVTYIETLDAELGAVASGDNGPPPECEFLTEFANQVFYISALGTGKSDAVRGTSPGHYVLPSKVSNYEAAPLSWRVAVGDEITGFATGIGRLFCLTRNSMPFITPTGRTEIARLLPTGLDIPYVQRPFWTKGGISPYNLIVIQGDVFSYSGRMPLRSPGGADGKTVPFDLGLPVQDLTAEWYDGYVFCGHDPKNQEFCIISSAVRKNSSGFWESEILPYNLQINQWMPVIKLTSTTRDMVVTGVATVDGRMEFLCGGRADLAGTSYTLTTHRYDERSGSGSVPYYIAFSPVDNGEELRSKYIKSVRVTGRLTSPVVQIHGAEWNSDISVSDIENGTNSISGNITLASSTGIRRRLLTKVLVKNLQVWLLRLSGTWTDTGTNEVDRLDETIAEVGIHGGKQ